MEDWREKGRNPCQAQDLIRLTLRGSRSDVIPIKFGTRQIKVNSSSKPRITLPKPQTNTDCTALNKVLTSVSRITTPWKTSEGDREKQAALRVAAFVHTFGGLTMSRSVPSWKKTDRLFAELDLKLVTGLKIEHRGVGLTNQQIAVALHLR